MLVFPRRPWQSDSRFERSPSPPMCPLGIRTAGSLPSHEPCWNRSRWQIRRVLKTESEAQGRGAYGLRRDGVVTRSGERGSSRSQFPGFLAAFHKERRFPITRSVQVLFSASLGELGRTAQDGVELSTPQLDRGSCGERTRAMRGSPWAVRSDHPTGGVEENSPGNAVTSALPPASGAQPVSPVSPQGPSVPCRLCQSGLLPFRCRTLSPPCAVASKRQGARGIPPG
jgi:hypothetical protein